MRRCGKEIEVVTLMVINSTSDYKDDDKDADSQNPSIWG